MANIRPTKLKFGKIVCLCFFAIFNPKKLIEEEKKDNTIRKDFSSTNEKEHNAYIVNRAFWCSLGLIILFGCVSGIVGLFLYYNCSQPSKHIIYSFQIVGACLLLWGTLFIRGWEIQTYCGVTLSVRVNQWLYRTLYCLGTGIIICSAVWDIK